MDLVRDKKGDCWILSHERCGYHESMFLTESELLELDELIYDIFEGDEG